MKKLTNKSTFLINLALSLILIGVYAISFIPETTVPISSGAGAGAIYNGNRDGNGVSLMFNVYENTQVVNGILDKLKEHGVKATFFVGGCWADDNGETLCRIVQEGHEIGNHGYFHKDHKKLSDEDNRQEIYLTGEIVGALCGAKTTLFAPPSGSFSTTTLQVADELGYKVIMWSKDTIDWRDSDKNLIVSRATKNLQSGDFILMHPKEHTLSVLESIIEKIKGAGFNFVTVSQNLST